MKKTVAIFLMLAIEVPVGFAQTQEAMKVCRNVNPAGAWKQCIDEYDQKLLQLQQDPRWQAYQRQQQQQLELQRRQQELQAQSQRQQALQQQRQLEELRRTRQEIERLRQEQEAVRTRLQLESQRPLSCYAAGGRVYCN